MVHALLRSRHARPQAKAATRLISSRWLSLASALAQQPAPSAGSASTPTAPVATVLESSHGRTLLRLTQGDTVVLASMRERADGRAASRGILAVEYKERSFARMPSGKGSRARLGAGAGRHDRRVEAVMTDTERCVASRIQRLLGAAIVGGAAEAADVCEIDCGLCGWGRSRAGGRECGKRCAGGVGGCLVWAIQGRQGGSFTWWSGGCTSR